jgi:hypothetical protein
MYGVVTKSKNLVSAIPESEKVIVEKVLDKGKQVEGKEAAEPEGSKTDAESQSVNVDTVVEIVDRFRAGALNPGAEIFEPRQDLEPNRVDLEPKTVVDIIEGSRSTSKNPDRSIRVEASTSSANQNTQLAPSSNIVDEYNEINAKCSDKLRKETEVKPPKKRGNFNEHWKRKKFQLNNNWNYHRN